MCAHSPLVCITRTVYSRMYARGHRFSINYHTTTNMRLFLDDEKNPELYDLTDVVVARTAEDAIRIMRKNPLSKAGHVFFLDHDLGKGQNGCQFLTTLIEEYNIRPVFVYIISWNSVGIQNIRRVCDYYNIPCAVMRTDKLWIINGQSG